MKDLDRYRGTASYGGREATASAHWRVPEKPIAVPPLPPDSPGRRWQVWAIGAFSVVALSAAVAVWAFLFGPLSAERGGLGLSADQSGPDVVMTWDAKAPAVRHARQGVLSVADGSYRKEITLDAGQLRNGHILYSPDTGDVLLQLEVVSPEGRRTSESIRVVGPVQKVRKSLPALVQPEPALARTARVKKRHTRPVMEYVPAPLPPVKVAAPRVESPKPVAAPPPVKVAAPRVESPKPVTAPRVKVAAPRVESPKPVTAPPVQVAAPRVESPKPMAAPPVQVAAARVESPKPVAAPPVPAPAPAANIPNYVAPKVIRQVAPVVPPEMRGFITHDVNVELLVAIDPTGAVSHVTPLSTGGDAYLLGLATNTVRQWGFQAARLNGRDLPSEMKLIFRFRAGGT